VGQKRGDRGLSWSMGGVRCREGPRQNAQILEANSAGE